ncbi:AsnC family protein [Rhizobium sp. YS-1r]|uniref:AsnC family protein n=1 Tax=Rhizobium sp. YS-1r TaxID=1532558 RepID=UPI000692001A|nr:AsnC family protein [Rhizobium sp. YS-1r]
MTDTWLENVGKAVTADAICRSVHGMLGINMALIVVDMQAKTPLDWRLDFIHKYGIPTSLADSVKLQQVQSLRDFPGAASITQVLAEACKKMIADGRPSVRKIDQRVWRIRIIGDCIVLPDPAGSWCVVLVEVHSLSAVGHDARHDDIDLAIIQLSREGLSAREIGKLIELSPRTIEHRIEKMKARAGVKGIVPLLIMKT